MISNTLIPITQYLVSNIRLFVFALCVNCVVLPYSLAEETFAADFREVDIHEFISTVSKILHKTIILDDNIKGKITARSYQVLTSEQYYQFFQNVLDVYGYVAINMPNNILKIVAAKEAKRAVLNNIDVPVEGDELIVRVVPLHNIVARDVAPILRQLNDSTGVGNVAHYETGNSLLITGRADVVNNLVKLAKNMDQNNQSFIRPITLNHASAPEVAKTINSLLKDTSKAKNNGGYVTADERTNTILIAGNEDIQNYVQPLVHQLDKERDAQGNTKVIRLKYAKAKSLMEVLTGISSGMQNDGQVAASSMANVSVMKNVVIKADEQTNSLIINAAPDIIRDLETVIAELDVRRAQVLVEAVIVEMQDADGLNFGMQWANKYGGGTQFSNAQAQISNGFKGGMNEILNNANGLVAGFYSGTWAGLVTAINSSSKNNILATPSIVTLDNEEAEFNVGQDVPILSGSQTTNSDNVFNTVSRKTVGIKLKVNPQINKGKSVLLQIEQEVSSVAENSSVDKDNLGATFNIRTVKNAVLVESGETVVVGGLLDRSQTDTKSGVPYLSHIPLVGNLFGATANKNSKRNLILFIRPTIIRSDDNFQQETLRKKQQFQALQRNSSLRTNVQDELSTVNSASSNAFSRAKQQIGSFYNQGR